MNDGTMPGDNFNDVFARDDRDRGADSAAPVSDGPVRDDLGRFAPKSEPAPKAGEPPKQAAPPEAPPASTPPPPEPPAEQNANRHVPLAELLGEREKRKLEAKLREEMESRVKQYEAQLAQYQAQMQQLRPPQEEQQQPDPWVDPQAALQHQQQQFNMQLAHMNANFSEMRARDKFGDEAVDAALKSAQRANAGYYFLQQRDPYSALMQWHRQQSFLEKVGSDPDAYEKSIEQRAYEKALADLKAGKVVPGGVPQPAQQAPQRFPGSLAEATPAGSQGALLTPESIAAELFDSNRNRRSA